MTDHDQYPTCTDALMYDIAIASLWAPVGAKKTTTTEHQLPFVESVQIAFIIGSLVRPNHKLPIRSRLALSSDDVNNKTFALYLRG